MSEINSIANGTFTIGQTSATNFVAGNGIKIDSPSEGVVRIGNDETVLYSGAVKWDGNVPLSEPISSFNEIKVYMETQNDASEYSLYYPGTTKTINAIIPKGDGNNDYLYNTRWTVGSTALSYYKTFIQSIGPNNQYKEVGIFKVVGINRISGSNA